MARKIIQGYCDQRNIDTNGYNLCDYFKSKRKKSKPSCKSCKCFHAILNLLNKTKKN